MFEGVDIEKAHVKLNERNVAAELCSRNSIRLVSSWGTDSLKNLKKSSLESPTSVYSNYSALTSGEKCKGFDPSSWSRIVEVIDCFCFT